MNTDEIIHELYQLLEKPPEDVAAKSRLISLTHSITKNEIQSDKGCKCFIDELIAIRDFTIDQVIATNLHFMIMALSSKGITA
jgi:hypothetical protein